MRRKTGHADARARLLVAGRTLFARQGYGQTSTSAIARRARTSESQLVRYFGGKAGLLAAIFDQGWIPLNDTIQRIVGDAPDARSAIVGVLGAVLEAFRGDSDMARLFLFEGRRIRGQRHQIVLSSGFLRFADMLTRLIRRGQQDGTISDTLDDSVVASALLGAAEGMIRDWMLAHQNRKAAAFPDLAIRGVFTAIVQGLGPAAGPPAPGGSAAGGAKPAASAPIPAPQDRYEKIGT